jgi:hypothetical protein
MAYHLEGQLLEVCDCRVLCPCWIGEDPDNGTCDSVLAYRFEKGTIDGVDVAGRTLALVSHIPGNVLAGNFRVAIYLDDGASAAQEEALLNVYTGKLGGPMMDFAKLFGEVVSVERAAIAFRCAGRQRHAQGRRGELCRAATLQRPGWFDYGAEQHDLFHCTRRPRVRRQGNTLSLEACGTWP